jgi:hypothetical protein
MKAGMEVKGRLERIHRKLLDDLKERRGYSILKEEALDRPVRRAGFGSRFRRVVRQTAKLMLLCLYLPPNTTYEYLSRLRKDQSYTITPLLHLHGRL